MLTLHVHFVIFLLQLVSLEIPVLVLWAEHCEFYRNMEDCCTKPSDWGEMIHHIGTFSKYFSGIVSVCAAIG